MYDISMSSIFIDINFINKIIIFFHESNTNEYENDIRIDTYLGMGSNMNNILNMYGEEYYNTLSKIFVLSFLDLFSHGINNF